MRGQAFDTMMLVISVIVAVAILGILLGFLGPIGQFSGKANTLLPDTVKQVSQKGYGLATNSKVEFDSGDRFFRQDAIGQAPIAVGNVHFACSTGTASSAICGSDSTKAITVTDTTVVVNSKVQGAVAACVGNDQQYHIIIGATVAEVSTDATTVCSLT